MNRYLPIAALVASLAPAVGIPATISVSEVTEIANDGRCSLLEALDNAEQDRGIHADCPAGSGADQLVLTPGHRYTLTEPWPGSDSGTPSLTGDLEVQGNEAVIERSMAANPFRLFEILGATVTIEGLTLRQGLTQDLMIGGGALRVVDADLTLREVVLTDNRSIGTFVFGGAIRMEGGTVLIEDSQIVDNTAIGTNPEHGGGAIAQFNGELTIRRSALLDNWADVPCNPASPDTVATTGGALRIEASAATGAQTYIFDSTLADNLGRTGGGIHVVAIADTGVGGIQDVFVQVMRSTVVYNQAVSCGTLFGLGDGIHVQEANGGQGLVAFGNTILHGNGRAFMGDIIGTDCSANSPNASFFPQDGSVLDPDDACPSFGFDAFEDDITAIIDPIRNDTHYVPLANGPAVDLPDAGFNCVATPDQLGNPRAGGPGAGGDQCDSGAIELQPVGFVFTLDVDLAGSGTGSVSSTPSGIDCPGTCAADFDDGEMVVLDAVPDPDQVFAGWSGACTGTGSCSVTMDQARSVMATFDEPSTYPLNVVVLGGSGSVVSNPAGIDCPDACNAPFATGSVVELTQTPAPGFAFDSWGGACSGDGACTVVMGQPRAVSANFVAVNTLNVSVNGNGNVTSSPAGIDCPGTCSAGFVPAEKVVLVAESIGGSVFTGWSGDCTGAGPCVVSMEQNRDVTAVFQNPGFRLTVIPEGAGAGTVTDDQGFIDCPGTCTATVPSGTVLTLSATPEVDSSFQGFAGDCQGMDCSITLDEERTVRAVFLSADQLFFDSFE